MKHSRLFALAVGLAMPALAAATGSAGQSPRYRVTALQSPAVSDPACLPGHTVRTVPWGLNNFGSVAADYTCYVVGTNVPVIRIAHGFVWSPIFGSQAIPMAVGALGVDALSVNDRGQVFGRELTATSEAYGIQWAPYGAYERIFVAPAQCGHIDSAAAGSVAGYSVGYGLRPDAATPALCSLKWLIRAPSGAITEGPLGGQPWDINYRNVAVGDAGSAAIKFQVITGRTQTLFAGDATSFGRAQDINDDGEVAGYLSQQNKFCGQAAAVSWDREGRMRSLPHLNGQVSSRALGIGEEEVVGQSGPGLYCDKPYSEDERAVLWRGSRATDLNGLIPQWLGITLTRAVGVNRSGQIVAMGFRPDEALAECPVLTWDENDNPVLDYSNKCHNFQAFVLTPIH